MVKSFHLRDWVSARIRQFYRWRHGTECARLLIFDQIIAFDSIATVAAHVRGHELGEWRVEDGVAAATCVRCGRGLVVYYSPLTPDMEGSMLQHGCKEDMPQLRHPVGMAR